MWEEPDVNEFTLGRSKRLQNPSTEQLDFDLFYRPLARFFARHGGLNETPPLSCGNVSPNLFLGGSGHNLRARKQEGTFNGWHVTLELSLILPELVSRVFREFIGEAFEMKSSNPSEID